MEEFIPKLESARDAREYALTLAEMATHTHDSHVSVRGKAMTEYFGAGEPAVELREIEGEPVVTRLAADGSVKESGTQVGDIILKVDGEPVRERMNRIGRYITASTAQAHMHMILVRLLGGSPGSSVTVTVRDHDGHIRERKLKRVGRLAASLGGVSEGEVFRLLDGNVGYADLTRLTVPEVDPMFERFKDAEGIIFDMSRVSQRDGMVDRTADQHQGGDSCR